MADFYCPKEGIMQSHELRQRYLRFFQERNHAAIAVAPLVPEHDSSVLFTTAGMHPLVPCFRGVPHLAGRRLVDIQPCLRTNDILEVGDAQHLTFFEMCGNWSLGDYWKEQSIQWSYAFLTEELGIDPQRLLVTCFAGDQHAPRDEEAATVWRALGIQRIVFLPREDNWWGPVGTNGPCGPDTEIFYDREPNGTADQTPATHPQRFCEIWNNVFMQYDQQEDGTYLPLVQQSVDTGLGLERVVALLQGVETPYETDLFLPLIAAIRSIATQSNSFAERVVADHVRAATFILAEGVRPGNVAQGYVVRRLIRRAVRYGRELGMQGAFLAKLSAVVIEQMGAIYPHLVSMQQRIAMVLEDEELRFQRTIARGEKFFHQTADRTLAHAESILAGSEAFHLYETYGFPLELTEEYAEQRGLVVDRIGFQNAFEAHQLRSREGAKQRFAN